MHNHHPPSTLLHCRPGACATRSPLPTCLQASAHPLTHTGCTQTWTQPPVPGLIYVMKKEVNVEELKQRNRIQSYREGRGCTAQGGVGREPRTARAGAVRWQSHGRSPRDRHCTPLARARPIWSLSPDLHLLPASSLLDSRRSRFRKGCTALGTQGLASLSPKPPVSFSSAPFRSRDWRMSGSKSLLLATSGTGS